LRELVDGHFFGEAASEDSDDASLQALAEFYCGKADPQTMELLQPRLGRPVGEQYILDAAGLEDGRQKEILSQGMLDINNIAQDWELPRFS
jgi:hypothetical protein